MRNNCGCPRVYPLSYTDPTGYFFKKLWDEIRPFVGIIVAAVMTYFCGPYCGKFGYAVITGAVAGASGAAANGGNVLQGAVIGAFTAAVTFGAGEIIQANGIENIYGAGAIRGVAGGLSSVLGGGKFGHGFAAAGASSLAGGKIDSYSKDTVTRGVLRSIVGGTVTRASGGKFANGAVSSAISYTFNHMHHEESSPKVGYEEKPHEAHPAGTEWFQDPSTGLWRAENTQAIANYKAGLMELSTPEQIANERAEYCSAVYSSCHMGQLATNGALARTSNLIDESSSVRTNSMPLSTDKTKNKVSNSARNTSNTIKGTNRIGSLMVVPQIANEIFDLSYDAHQYCKAVLEIKGC